MSVYTKIDDLRNTETLSQNDLFIAETEDGTKSVSYKNMKDGIEKDDVTRALGFTPPHVTRKV